MNGLTNFTAKEGIVFMHIRTRSYEMDMTQGSILPKMLLFAVPLILSSVLQLLFNAADVIVVGRFDGENALAAVGSTGALINLIVNVFLGLSVGTNVVVARYYGAGKVKETSDTIHTSIAVSLVGGVFLAVFGFFLSKTFLEWMGSPEEVLPLATIYTQIYFIGMPVNVLYNFGSAVLRAVGDTRRPLIYLFIAGVVNVILNLFFVIVLHMGVAGVALATIISQGISAALVFICLLRSDGVIHVDIHKLRISMSKLGEIARIGLPAGLQGVFFSVSNVLIQSTVNSFGSIAMAGNSVSGNIEGFIYVSMNAMHQTAITFTSQNVGARMYARLRKIALTSVLIVTAIGVTLDSVALLLHEPLIRIYNETPEVIQAATMRLMVFGTTYFTCGIMDTLCGLLRGLGATMLPTIVSLIGSCAFRIFWIYCILPFNRTLTTLYLSYPVSWVLTSLIHLLCFLVLIRKFPVSEGADAPALQT